MLNLIPQPQEIKFNRGSRVEIKSLALGSSLVSKEAQQEFLSFCALESKEENIIFHIEDALQDEEYVLDIGDNIVIIASTASGQLYALQTLKQILLQTDFKPERVTIHDYPRYKLRGMMLDVGRYFFSVEDVKKFIEKMAMHKLNLFHFHLTEDQGWRIQIDKYPYLTLLGSARSHTNFNTTPHKGFYTKEDIKEIVDYAHAFCIKVMPEFDIPGHSYAAISCYKELACFPRELPVATHWGVKHDVLCAGRKSTFDFVFDVIDEFCEMFPDEYFHIGGDEVPKHRWNLCPDCKAKMKELGLKDADALQIWFMNKVKDYCKSKGKQCFMWSWDLESAESLDSDLGFTYCKGAGVPEGRPFIDTATTAHYIDLPYGYISLKDSANHIVSNDKNCLGVEATLWSEYVPDMKKADLMTFPRLGAISENAWYGSCTWELFSKKLDFYYSFLDKNNCGYALPAMANPNPVRKFFSGLWFEKRQLTWEGITNIFDDKKIEKMACK